MFVINIGFTFNALVKLSFDNDLNFSSFKNDVETKLFTFVFKRINLLYYLNILKIKICLNIFL